MGRVLLRPSTHCPGRRNGCERLRSGWWLLLLHLETEVHSAMGRDVHSCANPCAIHANCPSTIRACYANRSGTICACYANRSSAVCANGTNWRNNRPARLCFGWWLHVVRCKAEMSSNLGGGLHCAGPDRTNWWTNRQWRVSDRCWLFMVCFDHEVHSTLDGNLPNGACACVPHACVPRACVPRVSRPRACRTNWWTN
jgi:hypothetical protein